MTLNYFYCSEYIIVQRDCVNKKLSWCWQTRATRLV